MGVGNKELLNHTTVEEIAAKHSKTNAQILLRWGIQHGFVVIPCSTSQSHIEENIHIWDFELTDEGILTTILLRLIFFFAIL